MRKNAPRRSHGHAARPARRQWRQPAKPSCRLAGTLRSRATLWLAKLQAPAKAAAQSAEEKRKQEQNDEDEKHDLRDSGSRPGDSAKSKRSCNQRYNKQRYDQAEHDAVLHSKCRRLNSRRARGFLRTSPTGTFRKTSSD